MPDSVRVTLTENSIVGLASVQRYRFLTIEQFARSSSLHYITAANKLRLFEQQGFLGHFGNTGVRGYGKTPKAYFLTRKGFELLSVECEIPHELLGEYKEVKVEAAWSPQMYHRLRTVDLLIALEVQFYRPAAFINCKNVFGISQDQAGGENRPGNNRLC